MSAIRKSICSATILGLAIAALPVTLTSHFKPIASHAAAAPGGTSGNGNGGGAGNSGSNGGNAGGGNSGGTAGNSSGGGGNAGGTSGNSSDATGHSSAGHSGTPSGTGLGSTSNPGSGAAAGGLSQAGRIGHGAASQGELAKAAGALNAAHASSAGLAHAAPGSRVGQIATYDRAMLSAISLPVSTPTEIAAHNAAIAAARAQLATASNKTLTSTVISQIDARLGLPVVDPTVGLTR